MERGHLARQPFERERKTAFNADYFKISLKICRVRAFDASLERLQAGCLRSVIFIRPKTKNGFTN